MVCLLLFLPLVAGHAVARREVSASGGESGLWPRKEVQVAATGQAEQQVLRREQETPAAAARGEGTLSVLAHAFGQLGEDPDLLQFVRAVDVMLEKVGQIPSLKVATDSLKANRKKLAEPWIAPHQKGQPAEYLPFAAGGLTVSDVLAFESLKGRFGMPVPPKYRMPKHAIAVGGRAKLADPSAAMGLSWCLRIVGFIGDLLTSDVAANPAQLKPASNVSMKKWLLPGIRGFMAKKGLETGLSYGMPKDGAKAGAMLATLHQPDPPGTRAASIVAAGRSLVGTATRLFDVLDKFGMDDSEP